MGKRKLKLDFDLGLESQAIGISSPLKDYRLIWFMNKQMGSSFKRIVDVEFNVIPSKPPCPFPVFSYKSKVDHLEFLLIANNCNGSVLIPSLKAANYILVINGFLLEETKRKLFSDLRKVKNVLAVFEIAFETHKKMDDLVMQLELHTTELEVARKKRAKELRKFDYSNLKKLNDESNLPKN